MTLARSAAVEADMAVATMVVVRGAQSDTSKQLFLAHPKISIGPTLMQNVQQVEPIFVYDFLGANGRALCAAILRACGVSPLRAPRARLLLCAL